MTMHMTPAGRQRLTEPSEGLRLEAYRDCVGVLTIGYGHTNAAGGLRVTPGLKITATQADQVLADDLGKVESEVSAFLKRVAMPREFDGMADLAFNIGIGNFRSSTMLRKFNANDRNGAADAFLTWNRAAGRVVSGLTHRRALERSWFLGDVAGEPTGLPLEPLDMPHGLHDHPDGAIARAFNRLALAA